MLLLALQAVNGAPMFVIMTIIAVCFLGIMVAMIFIAAKINGAVKSVQRIEARSQPVLESISAMGTQGRLIAAQGKEIAEQFSLMSEYLATATHHLSESAGLIRDEIAELTQLVSDSALTARDKVAMVSMTIDRTNQQVLSTTEFINDKVVQPAREIAAVMAGIKRGIEVLVAPQPSPIDRTYGDDEMFIG
jgi:methyl-accepting chemotaxis protein